MGETDHIHLKYLPVSAADVRWGAVVHTVGYLETAPEEDYPPAGYPPMYSFSEEKRRVLQEYQLIYIVEGSGKFTSASLGRWVPVRRGSMILLFPGEWHSFRPDKDTGWKEYWIGFSGQDVDNKISEGSFSKESPVQQVGSHDGIVGLYREAMDTAARQESGFQQVLGGIAVHLLGLAHSYARQDDYRSAEISGLIGRAKELIDERYLTITAEEVAEELNMGYSNFRKVFKWYTGFPPARYILDVRINKTKERLASTSLSVKEVASQMGFDNYEYFFTAFKRFTGMTPAEYRAFVRSSSD